MPHVTIEPAIAYRGGGRRFFTRQAAYQNVARKVVRASPSKFFDGDEIDEDAFDGAVMQVARKLEAEDMGWTTPA